MIPQAPELLPCPQTHYLKTWPEYFNEVLSGRKPFEWRVDDRNFKVGDRLVLQEYIPNPENPGREGQYTGREIHKTISYLFSPWATHKRTVVMAFTRPTPAERSVPQVREAGRNYTASAMQVCISLADEIVCNGGTASDVAQAIRDRALTARPSDAPVAWRRALETIANASAMFPWARDLARKALALPPDEPAREGGLTIEHRLQAVRATAIEECAKWHVEQAELKTNSLHCGDNAGTISSAHQVAAFHRFSARELRALAPARVTPSGEQPEIHSSDGGVEMQTHHGAAAAPITNVKAGIASGPSELLDGGIDPTARVSGDCGEFMPLTLKPLDDPNHDPGEHWVLDAETAYIFKLCCMRDRAERIVAALNRLAPTTIARVAPTAGGEAGTMTSEPTERAISTRAPNK